MSRLVIHRPHYSDNDIENLIRSMSTFYGTDGTVLQRYLAIARKVRDVVEDYIFSQTISGVIAESSVWSENTFPQSTTKSIATHLAREAQELKENPEDPSEMADIVLLLGHLAGITGVDLTNASREKLAINKTRKWGKIDAEGVVEHVREEQPSLTEFDVFVPPIFPIHEIDECGRPTGRFAVYVNGRTGKVSWSRTNDADPQAKYVRYLRTEDKVMY